MSVKYSIVVPTYKEYGNIEPLTRQLFAALRDAGFAADAVEMIIVDDNSQDGSVEAVRRLEGEGYPVSIAVRKTERGLSGAVIHGLTAARGTFLLVMDADLQHPPVDAPRLLRALERPAVEFVCGTRYGGGVAIDRDWPLYRRIISWGARLLARPLTPLSDPMSGFFAIRKDVFLRGADALNPIGYKIALELFVKCRVKKYEEVGFNFSTRTIGESKLTGKVALHYLKHLQALYVYSYGVWIVIAVVVLLFALLRSVKYML
ncbi:Glycosyltransferase 2-like [Trypanosoma melophagium]|uniref:Glycosyltransferase 2-like n=1 Tax=Trypanosoma melophagium TaxID=715481 RepID=UPI003519FE0A|nr:Glycosyltransferase 2-like [Trypanosoma melophagium]